MKIKTPVIVTLLGLALVAGISLVAAPAPVVPPPPPATPPVPAGAAGEFRARMAEKLGLSADQQKALDGLRAKQQAELQALKDSPDLPPDVRRDKARAIFDSYRGQMRAVLTPDQQKIADEMRGRMRERAGRMAQGMRGDRRGPAESPLAIIAQGERIKDRIAEKLQLTDEQRDKLEHLGRAFRAQQRDAVKKHLEEMRAVLTPEQQQKVDQWKQHPGRGSEDGRPPFLGLNEGSGDMREDMAGDPAMPPEET